MNWVLLLAVFIVGLVVGSFANVCIYRLPREESVVTPSSRCPACGMPIRPFDNIPLLSFVLLRGKCRSCGQPISWRYPVVELANALLYVLAFWLVNPLAGRPFLFLAALYLSTVFVIVFFIDLEHMLIPDVLTIPGTILGLVFSFMPGLIVRPLDSLIGLLVGGILFWVIAEIGERVFKRESMGGGDIKLAAMLGAFLGWPKLVLTLVLASFLGSLIGVPLKFAKRAAVVPFGPFLVVAALVAFYWGDVIIYFYLDLIGR